MSTHAVPRPLRVRPRTIAVALSLVAASLAPSAFAADPMTSATGGKLDSADRKFVEKAAVGGMLEVRMGELAKDKASDPSVKAFGERMVKDHSQANAELTKIAAAKGVTVPGTIDASHQKDVDKMAEKSGADFDKAYMKAMVSDHKTDIGDFEKEAKSGKDADLKSFAGKTLPTLQDHLKMAQAAHDKVK